MHSSRRVQVLADSDRPLLFDLVAFFQERVDLVVDGDGLARPATPWSTTDGAAPGDAVLRDR